MHAIVSGHRVRAAELTWRYATAADIRVLCGDYRPPTLKAVVILVDGQPEGMIGIAREEWAVRFFSQYTERLDPYLKSIAVWRAIKRAMQWVEDYPTDVYARAQHDEGRRILARLGFEQSPEDKDVFVWRKSHSA